MIGLNIHNTDAKCQKTKNFTYVCGNAFSHIGETHMGKLHSDGFQSHMIMNHLTLATFIQIVKELKYRSQAIKNEQQE